MIKLYRLNDTSSDFVELSAGTFLDPLFMGVTPGGSPVVKKVFIRNDDPTKFYSGISLRPSTTTGAALAGNVVKVKLLSGDSKPTDARWDAVAHNGPAAGDDATDPAICAVLQSPLEGGPIDTRLPELGVAGTADTKFYPLWIRAEAGKGCPHGTLDFSFLITYTEGLV